MIAIIDYGMGNLRNVEKGSAIRFPFSTTFSIRFPQTTLASPPVSPTTVSSGAETLPRFIDLDFRGRLLGDVLDYVDLFSFRLNILNTLDVVTPIFRAL